MTLRSNGRDSVRSSKMVFRIANLDHSITAVSWVALSPVNRMSTLFERYSVVGAHADVFAVGSLLAATFIGQPALVGTSLVDAILNASAAEHMQKRSGRGRRGVSNTLRGAKRAGNWCFLG